MNEASDSTGSEASGTPLKKQSPRWVRPLRAGLWTFACIVLSVVLAVLTNLPSQKLFSFPSRYMKGISQPTDLAGATVFAAAGILACYLMVRFLSGRGRQPPVSPRTAIRQSLFGAAIGAGQLTADVAVMAALGAYTINGFNSPLPLLVGGLMMISVACVEEGVFRAVVQTRLARHFGRWWSLGLTSLLFGLVHMGNPGADFFSTMCIALVAGTSMGAIYMLTDRIWAPIGLHLGWNWAAGSLWSVPVSGTNAPGWIQASVAGPTWLTGGAFGPEGSMVELVFGGAVAVWLILWILRRERAGKVQVETGGVVSDKLVTPAS